MDSPLEGLFFQMKQKRFRGFLFLLFPMDFVCIFLGFYIIYCA